MIFQRKKVDASKILNTSIAALHSLLFAVDDADCLKMIIEALLICMGIAIIFLSVLLLLTLRNGSQTGEGLVTVLVLGDIGRSPRMSNHSISFAKEGYEVQHVGYGGTVPHKNLTTNQKITVYHVMDTPEFHLCKFVLLCPLCYSIYLVFLFNILFYFLFLHMNRKF